MNWEQRALDYLPGIIFIIDPQCQVIFCNEAAALLWKRDKSRIINKSLRRLFPENDVLFRHLEQVFQEGKAIHLSEYQLQIGSQLPKMLEVSMNPMVYETIQVEGAVLSLLDRTHDLEAKEQEREKAIWNSMGLLLSSIAHEIQNPLGGIKGATQLLQRDLKHAKLSTEPTEMILHELGRIDRLVKQLLLHSQPLPLEWTIFNLHELLDTVIWFEENANTRGIRFQRYFDPSLPDLTADKDKLHQVFLNLIRNAVEASPDHAEITIRTQFCSKWQILDKHLDPRQAYYLVEIEDQGPGVPPNHLEQLFKPLFTTKRRGNGLGLSISFRILMWHRGLLQYRSSTRGGAVFQVYIPQRPARDLLKTR